MPRELSEAHKEALAAGRKKAAAERKKAASKVAIERVSAYTQWCKESAAHMGKERALEAEGLDSKAIRAKIGPMPRIPVVPDDRDYELAREIGAI